MNANAKAKSSLVAIRDEVVDCRRCPRLVSHREAVATRKTKRFASENYWGKPVPAFGDHEASVLVVGLAPAAHGANRTGRMFTGDRSGDWLYAAMYRHGFASQSESRSRDDGLRLLRAYVTAVVRCAPPENKPSRSEIAACRSYLVREIEALARVVVVIALGRIAFDGFLAAWSDLGREVPRPKPKFTHGADYGLDSVRLLASYHPSQQNTFTGRLTHSMFDQIFRRARQLSGARTLH
jgi:uracil-DNA glycosylase